MVVTLARAQAADGVAVARGQLRLRQRFERISQWRRGEEAVDEGDPVADGVEVTRVREMSEVDLEWSLPDRVT